MKRSLLLLLILLAVGSVRAQNSKAEAALIKADQDWLKVFAAKDLKAVDDCLDDGAVMAPF